MGISNYYFNNIDGSLINDDYWDFHITSDDQGQCLFYASSCQDTSCDYSIVTDDLVLWFDINQSGTTTDGTSLTSLTEWDGTTIKPSSGFTLCDFGLTGVDNGRYDRLSGLTVTITSADTKVVLYPVTGYTINSATATAATKGIYDYPWDYITGTTTTSRECVVGDTVCLNGGFYQGYFKLDFLEPNPIEETITATTNNNCSTSSSSVTKELVPGDSNAMIYDLMPTEYENGWSMETWIKWDNSTCSGDTGTTLNDVYTGNTGFFFYIGTRAENKFRNVFSGETGLYTCNGKVPLSPDKQVDVNTGGQTWFTTSSYRFACDNSSCVCPTTGSTNTGTTVLEYCDQLSENALGFRIKPDGKIGYRKMSVTGACFNNEFRMTGTTMEEGYSDNSVILSGDSWMHIVVTYTQGDGYRNSLPAGTLKFWVNGRVIYRVKNFIGLQLRALNEWSSKQLGVPFNITWGGGTQGLVESQTFGGPDPADRGLQLEKYFAGSFLGELSQLRFYEKPLNLLEIRNNFFVDCNRYCIRETFGGAQIIQPTSNLCGDCKSGTPATYLLYDNDCFIVTEKGDKITTEHFRPCPPAC